MTKALVKNTRLVGIAFLNSIALISGLPCLAQTAIYTTIQRPTVISPSVDASQTNFNSTSNIPTSSHECFQVDANSRIYVRDKSGSIHYYPTNSPSSYASAMTGRSRCN
jgi:hypothetical protein